MLCHIILLLTTVTPVISMCYYPDGTIETHAVPCSPTGDSQCCASSKGICLSNGHCMDFLQPFGIWRGSCTDRDWGASCPQTCLSCKSLQDLHCPCPPYLGTFPPPKTDGNFLKRPVIFI